MAFISAAQSRASPPFLSRDAYNEMKMDGDAPEGAPRRSAWLPFAAGLLAGAAGTVLLRALGPRPALDPRLLSLDPEAEVPPTVVLPGLLGSQLLRPDGTQVWLNLGNALGAHDIGLPARLPFSDSRDALVPGGLLGVDAALPRLFGFTEYADLLDLLNDAGFKRDTDSGAHAYHVFGYDWRRDLVESAGLLGQALDLLASKRGEPHARFNVLGHSMGGLVARYFLRYGGAEPGGPVTWDGARRIANLVMVATPSGGSIPALDALLNGSRVGFSSTTLAAPVVCHMPSLYQLLPPPEARPLLDDKGAPIDADLLDAECWERFGWGPWSRRARAVEHDFLAAVLARSRAFQQALARQPESACPIRVVVLGGDCLATPARAVVPKRRGAKPRLEPWSVAEAQAMLEAGDGRVTRASVLASHLDEANPDEPGCGIPEVSRAFFGHADHHGIYGEPTFQSLLLRLLLQPVRSRPRLVARSVVTE
jgi:alpha-beta hydrolase superfamily lysophospholipase